MNHLTIVRTVRELVGMQGTGPASVLTATGTESVLVNMVSTAYTDIQNLRDDFDFLNARGTFNTAIGQNIYTLLNVFGTTTPDWKTYDRDSMRLIDAQGKSRKLLYVDREIFDDKFSDVTTETDTPTLFTIDYADSTIRLHPAPKSIFVINMRYWKNPEVLTTDAQVPKLPLAFHTLIVYKAIEKMAIYLNSPATWEEYRNATNRMVGQLMRTSLRKLSLKTGALA